MRSDPEAICGDRPYHRGLVTERLRLLSKWSERHPGQTRCQRQEDYRSFRACRSFASRSSCSWAQRSFSASNLRSSAARAFSRSAAFS